MKYMLDASTVIHLLTNEFPKLTERVGECEDGTLAVSAIAFAEVALGSGHGKPPPPEALDGFLEEVILLPFDQAAARAYARLPFRRGSYDHLIAAHAIAANLVLVTDNEKDFGTVANLRIENWTR